MTKMLPLAALTLALTFGGVASLHAQNAAPTTKPVAKAIRGGKVTGDYAKMGTLTPEQKNQIAGIHAQSLADKKAVEAKEDEDILALLSADQKVELEKVREDIAAAKRKAAKAAGPATKPAGTM